MDWGPLPLWELTRLRDRYAVKVSATAIGTSVGDVVEDDNVRLELHVTDNKRLIGYTLKERRTRWKPMRVVRPYLLGLFYSDATIPEDIRKKLTVMYYDYNVRLLSFSDDDVVDYMLVLRARQSEKSS